VQRRLAEPGAAVSNESSRLADAKTITELKMAVCDIALINREVIRMAGTA
jgi:hypothetical protein